MDEDGVFKLWNTLIVTKGTLNDLKDLFRHVGWVVFCDLLKSAKSDEAGILDNPHMDESDMAEILKVVGAREKANQILALPDEVEAVFAELRKPTE